MTIERIILVTHNVPNHFHPRLVRDLGAAFEGLGFETQVFLPAIDGSDAAPFLQALAEGAKAGPEKTLLVDVNARVRLPDAEPFRRFSIIIDHAYQHVERLRALPDQAVVGFMDSDSPAFLSKLGINRSHIRLHHAASVTPEPPMPIPEREIDILFPGRLERQHARDAFQAHLAEAPPPVARATLEFADRLVAGQETSEAFPAAFSAQGIGLEQLDDESLFQVGQMAYGYAEAHLRYRVLTALEGLPVTVIGQVSRDFFSRPPGGFRFLGPQSFDQVVEAMGRSKICLNLLGVNPLSSHERMFYASAAGAVLATDGNLFVQETYRDGHSCAVISPESARSKVEALLAEPEKAGAIAATGRALVASAHSWTHRARDILAACGVAVSA